MGRKRTFFAAVVAVVVCFVAVGSAVGSQAKSRLAVALSPLIGTSANGVQKVTNGGKIGLHLDVTNPGPSTVNHVVVTVAADLRRSPTPAGRSVGSIPRMRSAWSARQPDEGR
jgi:hypothetical protein